MPQLWIETWVSQYFWLLVVLVFFHYFMVNNVIPTIATIFKIRKTLGAKEDNLESTDSNLTETLKIDLSTSPTEVKLNTNFASARSSWIKNTKLS